MQGLRPLGVGELLDAALKIYRSRAKTLLLAVAVPVLPVVVFSTLVSASAGDLQVDPATGELTADGGDLVLSMVGLVASTFAIIVATSVATAACYRSISGSYVGDDPTWKESIRFGFSRLWSVLGLTLLTALATLLGLVVCLVGALWPMAVFAVAMPAMLVEDLPAARSMGRSRALVKGSGWRVLGIVLLGTIIASVFQGMVSAPMVAVMFTDVSASVEVVVNGVFTMIATVLVTPFTAALTMALYVDLRVRKEGFDLYLWANRLGLSGSDGFPAQPGAPELPPGWGPSGYPAPGGFPPPYPQSPYPQAPQPHGTQPGGTPPPPPPPPPAGPGPGGAPGGQRNVPSGSTGVGEATSWGPPPVAGQGPDDLDAGVRGDGDPRRWNPPEDRGGWSG